MTMYGKVLATVGALALATPVGAATVVGATKVRVTNGVPTWLQVAEVQAVQYGTGVNVALASNGGTATGSGNYSAESTPDKAIDGAAPSPYADIYHSSSPDSSAFLDIFFAAPADLASLTIYGRSGCFCSDRDLFNVQIFNAAGAVIYTGQLDNRRLEGAANTLTFDAPDGAVPEPATWATMIGGFGLIGAAMRRRSVSVVLRRA